MPAERFVQDKKNKSKTDIVHAYRRVDIATARSNLTDTVNTVIYQHNPIVLTRRGRDAVAVISLEDLNKLLKIKEEAKEPKAKEKDIDRWQKEYWRKLTSRR